MTTTSLPELEAAYREAGVAIVTPVTTTAFGSQLIVRSPDGLLVKINRFGP